jgi:hypothetical protein
MLSVIMMNVIMLRVIMLSVIMMNVAALCELVLCLNFDLKSSVFVRNGQVGIKIHWN